MISNFIKAQEFFGEIVESSLSAWNIHCWQWDVMPAFGSLIAVEQVQQISNNSQENITIFGVVINLKTGSLDAHRTPFPYQKTEEELKHEQPQIFALLHTIVSCCTLGYTRTSSIKNNNKIFDQIEQKFEQKNLLYQLPPYPPKIHSFARKLLEQECINFCSNNQYLTLLKYALGGESSMSLEDVVLALYRSLGSQDDYQKQFYHCIKTFDALTNDYQRLKQFVERLQNLQNSLLSK